jgi:hypothetical protein
MRIDGGRFSFFIFIFIIAHLILCQVTVTVRIFEFIVYLCFPSIPEGPRLFYLELIVYLRGFPGLSGMPRFTQEGC